MALRAPAPGLVGAIARLAERADVQIALPAGNSFPAPLAVHENVTVLDEPLVAALAASDLVLTDAPAVRGAAAALGVPALVAGDAAPAALLQRAERLLDHGDLAREDAAAGPAPAERVHAGLLAA